ncbi:unnamed protein product [Rodentolepis nana]|uniref:SCP domain-containing protein n=1 Tax=Rodentolepis nana TaxID=102285 RepID=A0A0R3TKR3_RODNA|nr:unnamed protein product [Rodentolepis nana]
MQVHGSSEAEEERMCSELEKIELKHEDVLFLGIVLAAKPSGAQCGRGGIKLCGTEGDFLRSLWDMHNEYRYIYKSGPRIPELDWSPELAAKAQALANNCTFRTELPDKLKIEPFESVRQIIVGFKDMQGEVRKWFDRYRLCNGVQNHDELAVVCKDFETVFWPKATDLGCGLKKCVFHNSPTHQLVCNYGSNVLLLGIVLAAKPSETNDGSGALSQSYISGGGGQNVSRFDVSGGEPSAAMKDVLDMHNYYRHIVASGQVPGQPASYVMPDLIIATTVSLLVSSFVEVELHIGDQGSELGKKCRINHDPRRKDVGQNIVVYGTLKEDVTYWFNEYKNYNYRTNQCKVGTRCHNFKQMVWANTTDLGCGEEICKLGNFNLRYLVCFYFPT